MLRIGKSEEEKRQIAEMARAIAAYDGPIHYCRPGVARGDQKLAALATLQPNRRQRAGAAEQAANEQLPDDPFRTSRSGKDYVNWTKGQ
jgi:hypothetical protein